MILAAVVLVYAVFIEPQSVSLDRVIIELPGLPRDLEGVTILQISDVESRGRGRRENLVATLAAQARADIVVVTGDLVAKTLRGDSRLTATREAARLLGEIPSRYGTWFVEGHGEQLAPADRRKFLEALEDHGVHFLLDEVEPIRIGGAVLALAGIGLHPAGREAVFDQEPDGTIVDLGRGNAESFLNLLMPSGLPASEFEYSGEFRFSREEAGVGVTFCNQMPRRLDRFYRLRRTELGGVMKLSPHGTVFSRGRSASAVSPSPGFWHSFRIRVENSGDAIRVRARVWLSDDAEPESWGIDCLDATPTRLSEGTIGVWTSGPGVKEFRKLDVVGLDGTVLVTDGRAENSGAWSAPDAPDYLLGVDEKIPSGAFTVALAHSPDIFPFTARLGWPLLLAGHTQGGQVRLPFIGALATDTVLGRRFSAGLYDREGGRLFITRGIGTSRVPLRFLSPPELSLLTLHAAESGAATSPPRAGAGS
jgi:predicted MPP superfamily phosphohydrolase